MQKVAQFLLFASRSLAICAVLAGIGVGLLEADASARRSSALTRVPPERTMFPKSAQARCCNCYALRRARAAGAGGICGLLSGHRAGTACRPADPLPAGGGSGRRRRARRPPAARSGHPPGRRRMASVSRSQRKAWAEPVGAGPPARRRHLVRASWPTCNGAAERHRFHHGPPAFANDKTPDGTRPCPQNEKVRFFGSCREGAHI